MSKDQLKQEFPVLIGIDWADQKHDVCIQVVGKTQVIRKEIDHTPEALREIEITNIPLILPSFASTKEVANEEVHFRKTWCYERDQRVA